MSSKGRKGFAPRVSDRKAFEAVLYRERTGCPWRDVPAAYGPWHTIYMRWQRWVDAGVPHKAMIVRYLEAVKTGALDQSLALLDSTVVRAYQRAAGAHKEAASPRTQLGWPEYEDPHRGRSLATATCRELASPFTDSPQSVPARSG